MHVADTMLVEVIPIVINKPCGAGSFCNLVAVPENKIHVAIEFLTVVAEDSANLQRGRITGCIAGHAGFPGVQVGADQQKFITAAIAVQNCCGLVDDAPGAIGDGSNLYLNFSPLQAELLEFKTSTSRYTNTNNFWNAMKIRLGRISPHTFKPAAANNLFIIAPVHAHDTGSTHFIGDTGLFRYRRCVGYLNKHHLTRYIDILVGGIVAVANIDQFENFTLRFGCTNMGAGQTVNFHFRF